MKRHRRSCGVWRGRDKTAVSKTRRKETVQDRYGVDNIRHIGGVDEKRKATIQDRYGAANVFSRGSSIFDKVQEASREAHRPLYGEDNPFSKPEVQAKIRATWQGRHGVDNPQQVPEIRQRARETNLNRYGVEETLAAPEVRAKIRETCEEKYGGPAPSCDPEVVEKARQTNLERFGVPWTCQDPDVRRRQLETMEEHYGGHFFASDEGKEAVRQGMLAKYGVENYAQIDGFWEQAVRTFVEKYGVTHPLQLAEFMEKRRLACQEQFGVDFPLQSPDVLARLVATCQERYGVPYPLMNEEIKEKGRQTNIAKWGVPHPMMDREYARKHLERMKRSGPNMFEIRVGALDDRMLFMGDGSWWRWLPKLKQHKNPDFIVPGPDPKKPKKGVAKVIEAFGDYWHSRMFTGKAPFEHEQELIDAFAEIGVECLVIWEGELKSDPEQIRRRLSAFIGV